MIRISPLPPCNYPMTDSDYRRESPFYAVNTSHPF